MNWGVKIFLSFVVFIAIIISMVVISVKQEFHLVSDDYYARELVYQEQIDKMGNLQLLSEKPKLVLSSEGKYLMLNFPQSLNAMLQSGEIHFFRPSDARLDTKVTLEVDKNGQQVFSTKGFVKGMWRAKIQFKAGGKEYFHEQTLVL